MAHDIRPLTEADLGELGAFLAAGFHAPAGAAFAAADVLRWKYLDPCGDEAGDASRSYLAREPGSGRVVGHVGVCRGRFHGGGLPPEGVSTLHMIDWLASGEGKGAGASLMRRAHGGAETQYGFGGSAAGRGVIGRGGYALVAEVPVFHRVLRPAYRLKDPGRGPVGRVLRLAKDAAGVVTRARTAPRAEVEARRVTAFGAEVGPVLAAYERRAVFTSRDAGRLNYFLRYPRGGFGGWHLWRGGRLVGLAVLSVVPGPGGVRVGKVAECLLDDPDDDAWHAAFVALTAALKTEGADLAVAFAANEWTARALLAAGYRRAHGLEFRLRDRSNRVPGGAAFHLTPLEADYAYI